MVILLLTDATVANGNLHMPPKSSSLCGFRHNVCGTEHVAGTKVQTHPSSVMAKQFLLRNINLHNMSHSTEKHISEEKRRHRDMAERMQEHWAPPRRHETNPVNKRPIPQIDLPATQ